MLPLTYIQFTGDLKGIIDTTEETLIPLTFSLSDVRDLAQRNGTYSKSIKVLGTKNNNKLFNYYFDVNFDDQNVTFDINKLAFVNIIQNGTTIMDNAVIQLVSVNKKQETNLYDDEIEYNLVVRDTTADFFNIINNKFLDDIKLNIPLQTLNAQNVINSFDNTIIDGFKYLMGYVAGATGEAYSTANDASVTVQEFKPAVYARQYFDHIFYDAGYSYQWDSMNISSVQFDKLLIPYNGDEIKEDATTANDLVNLSLSAGTPNITIQLQQVGFKAKQTLFKKVSMVAQADAKPKLFAPLQANSNPFLVFDPLTQLFTVPANFPPNDDIKFTMVFDCVLELVNNSGAPAIFRNSFDKVNGSSNSGTAGVRPYVKLIKSNGAVVDTVYLLDWDKTTTKCGTSFSAGTTTITQQFGIQVDFATKDLVSGDQFKIELNLFIHTLGDVKWTFGSKIFDTHPTQSEIRFGFFPNNNESSNPSTPVFFQARISNVGIVVKDETYGNYSTGSIFNVNTFIPKKIKQSEFIKSVAYMYNLFFEVDKSNPKKINIFRRDDFYDSGKVVDWTYKLDKGVEQELRFLPELQNKRLLLTYKPDKDFANETYQNSVNETYSQFLYTFDNDYVKDVKKIELGFSPTPIFFQPALNAVLPMINGFSPNNNMRILYDGGQQTCNNYRILEVYNSSDNPEFAVNTNKYPLATHWDKIKNPQFSIEFGNDKYYFLTNDYGVLTNNNLFNLHWRRTLRNINTGRMFTGQFFLTETDIATLRLNQKVLVNNSYWVINKIIDYDANANKTTKVELINIEDKEIEPIFLSAPPPMNVRNPIWINLINHFNNLRNPFLNNGGVLGGSLNGFNNILVGASGSQANVTGSNNNIFGNGLIFGDENITNGNISGSHLIQGNGNSTQADFGTMFGNGNIIYQGADRPFIFGDFNEVYSGAIRTGIWGNNNVNSGASDTYIWGNGNIIPTGLTRVNIWGDNVTATTSNTSYFDNIRISSGSTINDIPIQAYMGGVNDTGVIQFTGATIILPDKITIPPVDAWFVDNETNPLVPTKERIHFTGVTNLTIPTISGGSASYVLLKKDGTLLFQNNFPTSPDRKTYCFLGKVGHPNGIISVGLNLPDVATSPNAQLRDLWKGIGFINRNVAMTPISGLTVGRSAGTLFGNGVGYIFNPKAASEFFVSAQTQSSLIYRTQTGGTFTGVTQLNPGFYDVGGTVTPVGGGANSSTLQYCFAVPNSNQFLIQYGQVVYTNLTDAIAAVGKEPFVLLPSLIDNSILISIIAINKNATNVNDPTQVRFFNADIFGQIIGAAGGTPTTNLQGAYNNSTNPEIIENSTLRQINIRGWDNTQPLMEFENTTGGTVALIFGNGEANFNGLTIGKGGGLNQFNTAIGFQALSANTSGTSSNTAVGYRSLLNTIAGQNTAIGTLAMQNNTVGNSNIAIGFNAMGIGLSGNSNVAIGTTALFQNLLDNNTGVGTSALANLASGTSNTAIGAASLLGLQGAMSGNTAIGADSGRFIVNSGSTQNTGATNSIFIGYNSRGQQNTNNAIVIGANANGLGANNTVIGTTATTASTIYGLVTSNGFKTFTGTSQLSLQADGSTQIVTGGTYTPIISGETNTGGVIVQNATFNQVGTIVTGNIGFFFTPATSGNTRFVASLPVNKTNFSTINGGSGSANDNVNPNIRSTVFGQLNAPNNMNVSLFVTNASGNQWVANVSFQYTTTT